MSAYIKFTTNCFTMAKQKHLSQSQSQIAALLQCAPPWFVRDGCTFTKSTGKIHLNFAKACSCGRRQQTVPIGNSRALERAEKVGAALGRTHNEHQTATVTASAPATGEEVLQQQAADIERLKKALKVQRAASSEFEHQAGVNKRKAEAFEAARTKTAIDKRVKTAKDNKAQPIDHDNQTPFGKGVRSSKMLGTRGVGIVQVMEEHCEGSQAKLLDIIKDLIGRYKLQDAVAAHLGASTESTAQYIVKRARAALKELKHCRSETQRQQYRLVLTILAPEFGMAVSVAAALGVERKCKPLLDSIRLREELDKKIEANKKRLEIGEEVLCRHGKGVLVEVDSNYEDEDEDCAHPCAVEIEVDGHKQISKFKRSGRGKGGARLHRIPISFAHGPRKVREDATSANVKQKVCHFIVWYSIV